MSTIPFRRFVAVGTALFVSLLPPPADAALSLLEKNDWRVLLGGFVSSDLYFDGTRSYVETIGSAPVERTDTSAGRAGRSQFSVRSSRLSLELQAPPTGVWSTRGYFEFDFLGYNPAPSASNGNSENTFFTNPTFRARHAYLVARSESWELLAGQTWSMFGWQPYYFAPTSDISSVAGELASRNPQVRAIHTVRLNDITQWQLGGAVARPPQRDGKYPAFDGGVRVSFASRTAGYAGGTGDQPLLQPMSFGLSGTARQFALPRAGGNTGELSYFPGGALAGNFFVPIVSAGVGARGVPSGTLALAGAATFGRGYGDHFQNWTGNLSLNPGGANMDAGIGGQDTQANFRLLDMRSYVGQLQYHLPERFRTWLWVGYGQLHATNASLFVSATGERVYSRQQAHFLGAFHEFAEHIRLGAQWQLSTSNYADGLIARSQRLQLSAILAF